MQDSQSIFRTVFVWIMNLLSSCTPVFNIHGAPKAQQAPLMVHNTAKCDALWDVCIPYNVSLVFRFSEGTSKPLESH